MLQGLIDFTMTVPAATVVFCAAYFLSRRLERMAARAMRPDVT